MVEEKGLAPESADKIGQYVQHKGGRDLLEFLKKDDKLTANASAAAGLKDMEILFDYLEVFDVMDKVNSNSNKLVNHESTSINNFVLSLFFLDVL
jgi:histidyl-tRNA synthetase